MKTFFEQMIGVRVVCEYTWNDDGIVRIGAKRDVVAYTSDDFTGKCTKCPFGEVCKAGCSAMALSQTGTLTETPFCIRQLELERIIKEMIG